MKRRTQFAFAVLALFGSPCIACADETCASLRTPRAVTVLENVCSALIDSLAGRTDVNINEPRRQMLLARGQFLDRVSELHMRETYVDVEHMRHIHSTLVSLWTTNPPELRQASNGLKGTCERLLTADTSSGVASAIQVQRSLCGTP
jgi:hypothetical protein